jgi:Electron transfer DM13
MKKLSICLTIVLFNMLMISCKKEEAVTVPPTEIATGLTTVFQGTFAAASHPTSGTVKLSKDASGKKFLVFENFKTDAGPDLRIYLSDDLKATNYTEITNKVTVTGNYQLPVDASIDTEKKRKVLIWCQQFSVLFGSADLK